MGSRTFTRGKAMNALLRNRYFLIVIRLVIGGLFVYAGFLKALKPQAFADSIVTFQMLPKQLINVMAMGLPPFEILVGAMLIMGIRTKAASLAAILMSVIFSIAILQGLIRGLQIDCGCFGSGTPSAMKNWLSLGRDLLLIAGGVLIYRDAPSDSD